jgi:hypothetical protein
MTPRRRVGGLALAAAVAVTGAGCGSVASQARPGVTAPPPRPPALTTTMVTAGGTWAVAVLGGSAASENNFWQVFMRPAGSTDWRLVTPPGVASNGGLVLAGLGGQSLIAGFRPSQGLVFSPLASTSDDGAAWSGGVLDAALADVPGALAATAGGGHLLALLSGGEIERAGPGAAAWSRLTSLRSLAATPAGRRCGPAALTAVAFAPPGTAAPSGGAALSTAVSSGPAVSSGGAVSSGTAAPAGAAEAAAACTHPGVVGIFADAGGSWQAAGPALPAAFKGWRVQVLQLSDTSSGQVALLAARSGRTTDLLTAWSNGSLWTVSAPLGVGAGPLRASGFGAAGAAWVLLANGQADTIAGPGSGWRALPPLPRDTAALALSAAGGVDALTAHASTFADWRLPAGGTAWRRRQTLFVPIQYGSSS